jgi:phosphoribosylglycinamide formyltransferase-1
MSKRKFRIAIFASGNGSNAEAIMRHFSGHQTIEIALVLSNNSNALVIDRASKLGIPSKTFTHEEFKNPQIALEWLKKDNITHIVLAGFLWLIPDHLINAYPDKIINIHPALLPRYGGKGMYGMKVHQAVKAAAEKETGITIHLVNEHYDEGKILFQERCSVEENFTAEQISRCVQQLEYAHYPKVIEDWILKKP